MADQSGAGSPVLSLPKGGGALQGIGEKFAPDLHTGTGNFTVPIALPPGRNGFQPQLSLVYSTGNGNGPFGLGWSLSIPGVSRKTSDGVPRYDDAQDTFLLSGAEDLVPVLGQGQTIRATARAPRACSPASSTIATPATITGRSEARTVSSAVTGHLRPQESIRPRWPIRQTERKSFAGSFRKRPTRSATASNTSTSAT